MTLEMWLVLGILVTAIILFITEWVRVDVAAMGVVVLLMITNVLTPAEALSGFSSSSVLTIAALFVVGGAVLHTGLAGTIGRRILAIAGTNEIRLMVVLMLAVALLSGFMSDTGTVAVLLPAVIALSKSARIPASKLLIPLAFGSLLGGAMTLIGTPPNIIVSDLLKENGLEPFGFFDYTPMGLILLIAGVIFMVFVGRRLLPDRRTERSTQDVATPKQLIDLYRLPDNLFRLRVRRGSELVDQTLKESGLRHDYELNVLKIMRLPHARPEFSIVRRKDQQADRDRKKEKAVPIIPEPDMLLELDDVLIVQGDAHNVTRAAYGLQLGVQESKPKDTKALVGHEAGIAEVVLPPRSSLIGKSLVDVLFGGRYRLSVLNIFRPGETEKLDLKTTKLEFGDTLLVQGPWENILALKNQRRDFVVMGQPEAMIDAPHRKKAPIALIILLGMVLILVLDLLPTAAASLLAGLAMVLTGCLTMDEAYEAINWKSIVLVAGMLPMSIALEKVGLVDLAADALTSGLGSLAPSFVLAVLFLITSLFTQVISNTATAVIIAPIAFASAMSLGITPHAFLMGVAIAASMAFASPVASPVNTLVMGAGSYRFGDYMKIGVPMIVIMLILSVIFLPILWPF